MQRVTAQSPCPICGGHDRMMRGRGQRCFGFVSDDGEWAHCTREDLAGGLPLSRAETYAHRLAGECKCGTQHGEAATVHGIGESSRAPIVATYDYRDENGQLRYQVVRKHPKSFLQRRPDDIGGWIWNLNDTRPLLYRLPELLQAIELRDDVWIVEGEKDADALHKAGLVATCNSGGAGKFHPELARFLKDASVVIVRDKDPAGHDHARDVFVKIRKVVRSIRVVEAREGKDAADHLAAGHDASAFIPVWPLSGLRKSDPVAWKQAIVRSSLQVTEPYRVIKYENAIEAADDPRWPTGLEGGVDVLPNFRGVTIVAGPPGSAKSYLALASSIQAAWADWDSLYLASEMGEKGMATRAKAYCEGPPPENWQLIMVDFGAGLESLAELITERVTAKRMLVILDSISSFVDQGQAQSETDIHGIGPLKRTMMWALNVKRRTEGHLSFLIVSEVNREGRTKGRFGDHKADLVVAMTSDEKDPFLKGLRIVKGWEYQLGEVGMFNLNIQTARLWRVE